MSRSTANRDLLNRLLESSDPLISGMWDARSKPKMELYEDARYMLDQEDENSNWDDRNTNELKFSVKGTLVIFLLKYIIIIFE